MVAPQETENIILVAPCSQLD